MENRIYFKGDIKKVAQNLNFAFKKLHEGYYSIKEGRKSDNYPMDFPYGFIEIVVSKDERFCIQRLYIKDDNPTYKHIGDYEIIGTGHYGTPRGGQTEEEVNTVENYWKAHCFTRNGLITNGIIKWGSWAQTHTFAAEKGDNRWGNQEDWISQNLVEKKGKNGSPFINNTRIAAEFREEKYEVPSLDFLSQARQWSPAHEDTYWGFDKDTPLEREIPEDFTFRYLGQVEDLMDKPEGYERWTFMNNKYGKENFYTNKSSLYISGYYIKRPGIAIDIPDTNKDSWGILRVYTYPQEEYYDQQDFAPHFRPEHRNLYLAPLSRGINRGAYDNDQTNANTAFKRRRMARMYIYEQLYPKRILNQFIWDIFTTYRDSAYDLRLMPVPKLIMEGRPFNPNTGDAIQANLNPYGWYDITRGTRQDWRNK